MKNKILYITIIIIIVLITIIMIFKNQQKAVNNLVSPKVVIIESTPSPSPMDLEKELESVDPKVLDSDFNE